MTIKILSKGILPYKPVYHGVCLECWTTFTYEPEDIKHDDIKYAHEYKVVYCPICNAKISADKPIAV